MKFQANESFMQFAYELNMLINEETEICSSRGERIYGFPKRRERIGITNFVNFIVLLQQIFSLNVCFLRIK